MTLGSIRAARHGSTPYGGESASANNLISDLALVRGIRRRLAGGGATRAGRLGRVGTAFAPVAKAKIVLESLVSKICLVSDEKDQHRPTKYAFQVAVDEFHGYSVWLANRIVACT